jgi:hypothetical protein
LKYSWEIEDTQISDDHDVEDGLYSGIFRNAQWKNDMTVLQEETWTLDRMMQLTGEEITEIWETLPASGMRELQGEYEGHIPLAGADEAFIKQINETMKNENGPDGLWVGKAFNAIDDDEGEGYNHWRKSGTSGIRKMRYRTGIEISEIDGKPALMMDYSPFIQPSQEWYFKDEVRKLNDEIHILMGVSVTVESGKRSIVGTLVLTGPIHDWVGPDEESGT